MKLRTAPNNVAGIFASVPSVHKQRT